MSNLCEVVKVKTEDGYKIINKSDIKKDDVLFVEKKETKSKKK